MKMKFPVIDKSNRAFPSKPVCPVCGEKKVLEPHSMAILMGGALEKLGEDHFVTSSGDKIVGFLSLAWHGAHDDGEGDFREKDYILDLVNDSPDGQFQLAFCSTTCLRKFLNKAVDELESKLVDES
jgi:hypothetical protein